MSPMLSSQGVVLATAMAVSGTVILLAFRHQKLFSATQFHQTPKSLPRSCISSDEKKREKKKKKRVHFAEDVVDPKGNGEEFRKQHDIVVNNSSTSASSSMFKESGSSSGKVRAMPANRVALYNGILRDRVIHRLACAY